MPLIITIKYLSGLIAAVYFFHSQTGGKLRFLRLSLPLLLLFSSCQKPHCCRPHPKVNPEWSVKDAVNLYPPRDDWWEIFDDAALSFLIRKSFEDNYGLKAAYEKCVQGYYLRRQISALYYPWIDGAVNYTKSQSQFAFGSSLFGNSNQGGQTLNFANGVRQELFLGGVDAIWEIDLFQHTYHQVRSACAYQRSLVEMYHAMKVNLAAETASIYFRRQWEEARSFLLKRRLQNREEQLKLSALLNQKGIESEIPLMELHSQTEVLRKELSDALAQAEIAKFHLIALLGELPSQEWELPFNIPHVPKELAIGIPAEVLRRRPDIRKAEMDILQAGADIDVAIADFFPRIDLTGGIKWERTTFGPAAASGLAWSYGARLFAPILHGGKLQAQLKERKSAFVEKVYAYYETVVQAMGEAEGAIAAFLEGAAAEGAADRAFRDQKERYAKVDALHLRGVLDQMALLEAEEKVILAEYLLSEARYQQLQNIIFLYKILGGGWACA